MQDVNRLFAVTFVGIDGQLSVVYGNPNIALAAGTSSFAIFDSLDAAADQARKWNNERVESERDFYFAVPARLVYNVTPLPPRQPKYQVRPLR